MIPLIESRRTDIAALCGRFGVRSLDVFGSAADGSFDSVCSDIDFLVHFNEEDAGSLFHRYFGLREPLEQLFDRKIDLVSASTLSNPYFIDAVNQSRQSVYASARAQVA
ncbi:MAG: nucleotidyltransferase domain-containing protein [Rhodoferax sp.]|nr:nucleotidyltransferase domain-containing protein [Rhodoferax sp.]